MNAVLGWMILTTGSTGLILRLFERLQLPFRSALEKIVFAASLGLAFMSYLVFVVGLAGFLHRTLFLMLGVTIFIIGFAPFLNTARPLFISVAGFFRDSGRMEKLILILATIVFLLAWTGAMSPPTGQDELCYHLAHPKEFVRSGAVYAMPFTINSTWPYLMEMLYTLGLLMHGPALAKLFHLTMLPLTALGIFCFLRRQTSRQTALWGFAAFILTPAAFLQAAYAYVDNALACYAFLSFFSLCLYLDDQKKCWIFFAGVFAGLAASVKYVGLFVFPALLVVWFWEVFRAGRVKQFANAWACFVLAAFMSGGAWYVRAWVTRGNPFFPFLSSFFGGRGWEDPTYVDAHGRGQDLLSFLLLPWDVTMHPGWFGGESVGPFFLAFAPLVFLCCIPFKAPVRRSLLFCLVYTAVWFVMDPNVRFLFPVLAVLSVPTGLAVDAGSGLEPKKKKVFNLLKFFGLGVLIYQASFAVYHFERPLRYFLQNDPEGYLTLEETYQAAKAVNAELIPSDRILAVGEVRGYYFNNFFGMEGDLARFTNYPENAQTAAAVASFLKQNGYTHVLLRSREADPNPLRLAGILKDRGRSEPYFKTRLIVGLGEKRYTLYKIL